MYTKQTVQLKKISLCLKKKKKRITRSGAKSLLFLTTYSNDLKEGKGVQMVTEVLSV